MTGDAGPYMEMDGPSIWVPRTVSYREAREIAKTGMYGSDRLVYVGKSEATLYGFSRDCWCDESCELKDEEREDHDPNYADACIVPVWHFTQEER